MPQKTRREKERAAQRRESGQYRRPIAPAPIELPAPERSVGVTTTPAASARRNAGTAPMPSLPHDSSSDFNYSYVYGDLRRILILAVLCFGAMIVLTFVLR